MASNLFDVRSMTSMKDVRHSGETSHRQGMTTSLSMASSRVMVYDFVARPQSRSARFACTSAFSRTCQLRKQSVLSNRPVESGRMCLRRKMRLTSQLNRRRNACTTRKTPSACGDW